MFLRSTARIRGPSGPEILVLYIFSFVSSLSFYLNDCRQPAGGRKSKDGDKKMGKKHKSIIAQEQCLDKYV